MRSPNDSITGGYDVHLVFTKSQKKEAEHLFATCLSFLDERGIKYQNHICMPCVTMRILTLGILNPT